MKPTIYAVLITGFALIVVNSLADIQTPIVRLDHAIYPKHDPKLIVAGEISEIDWDDQRSLYPPEIHFRFFIDTVILGQQSYRAQTLIIPAPSFAWPTELLPFQEGTRCALVLGKAYGTEPDSFSPQTVIPLTNTALQTAGDGESAKRILEREILGQLADDTDQDRQCALLLQVAPILSKDSAASVMPYAKRNDIWLMRAALSALIYATEDPEYIRQAAVDIQQYFSAAVGNNEEPTDQQLFFKYYFFLEKRSWTWGSRWDEKEAHKHLRILNTLFSTGLINEEVKMMLDPEQSGPAYPPQGVGSADP